MKIAIIGAGIIGSSTAFKLLEQFGNSISLTIFSEDFSPHTTGDVSAGLWGPRGLNGTSQEKILKWSKDTHDFFHKLWKSGEAAEAGIALIPVTRITTDSQQYDVLWRNVVFGCMDLDTREIERLRKEHKRRYTSGIHFATFTCEPLIHLPYLYKRILKAGGKIMRKRIASLEELHTFNLIINCTGIGARTLIKNETDLKPVRGQVMRVKAPWILDVLLDDSDDGNYIIPNINSVVLGGTHQVNNDNKNVAAQDRTFIENGCAKLNASLTHAELINEAVGLRPGRHQVRLEKDTFFTKDGKKLQIIHNYGHGGSGVTLSYGCAIEVCDIVSKIITDAKKLKSQL